MHRQCPAASTVAATATATTVVQRLFSSAALRSTSAPTNKRLRRTSSQGLCVQHQATSPLPQRFHVLYIIMQRSHGPLSP
jgi:hypothetical protein